MSCVLCVLKLPQHCSECRLGLRQWRPDSSKASESHSWGFLFCERYQLDFESVPSVCAELSKGCSPQPPPSSHVAGPVFVFPEPVYFTPVLLSLSPMNNSKHKEWPSSPPRKGGDSRREQWKPQLWLPKLGREKKKCVWGGCRTQWGKKIGRNETV